MTARAGLAVLLAAAALAGCGGDDEPPAAPEPSAPAGTAECGTVTVPGHEGVGIRADGVDCTQAKAVATAAEGRGRAPYEAEGFSCEPTDAPAGDTDYACTKGDASVTFRWGTS